MLRRTISPGDIIRVDGPCDLIFKRRRGRLTAIFDAPHATRVTHKKKKRRVDKQGKRRSN